MIRIMDVKLMDLESKIKKVKDAVKGRRVAVGFSGGADSTALLDIAGDSADAVAAFTVDTGVMPRGFIENASSIARSLGVEHFIINRPLLENQEFVSNTPRGALYARTSYTVQYSLRPEKGVLRLSWMAQPQATCSRTGLEPWLTIYWV